MTFERILLAIGCTFLLALFLYLLGGIIPPVTTFLVKHLITPVVTTIALVRGAFCTKCAHSCRTIFCYTRVHFIPKDSCPECQYWVKHRGENPPSTPEEQVEFIFGSRLEKALSEMLETKNDEPMRKVMSEVSKYMGRAIMFKINSDQSCPDSGRNESIGECGSCQCHQKDSSTQTTSCEASPQTCAPKSESVPGENQSDKNAA